MPYGFAFGASLDDISGLYPNLQHDPKGSKEATYTILMQSCLLQLEETIRSELPCERVTVIHDSGGLYGSALHAFNRIQREVDPKGAVFITMTSMKWQDCPALQVADLMAYEGFKLTKDHLLNKKSIQKSLQYLIDEELLLAVGHLPKGSFESLAAGLRNEETG